MYICKSFAPFYLERRIASERLSFAGAVRGESQTREAATMGGVQRQPLSDGKLIMHEIVPRHISTLLGSFKGIH